LAAAFRVRSALRASGGTARTEAERSAGETVVVFKWGSRMIALS